MERRPLFSAEAQHPENQDEVRQFAIEQARNILEAAGVYFPEPETPQASLDHSPVIQEATRITPEAITAIMGRDLIRPLEVERATGRKVEEEQFTRLLESLDLEMLARIKELGGFLSLRTDKAGDGSPLTAQWMQKHLEGKLVDEGLGRIFYNTDWYNGQGFFKREAPKYGKDGLALVAVTKNVIEGTTSKNYAEQTAALADFLRDEVYRGRQLPNVYREAIDEFEGQREQLTRLQYSDWEKAARRFSELPLSRLMRRIFAETIYDSSLYLRQNNERLLPDRWDWTHSRASGGRLVAVGYSDANGVYVNSWTPGHSLPGLGVCASWIVSQI